MTKPAAIDPAALVSSVILDCTTGKKRFTIKRDPSPRDMEELRVAFHAAYQDAPSWRLWWAIDTLSGRLGGVHKWYTPIFAASAFLGSDWIVDLDASKAFQPLNLGAVLKLLKRASGDVLVHLYVLEDGEGLLRIENVWNVAATTGKLFAGPHETSYANFADADVALDWCYRRDWLWRSPMWVHLGRWSQRVRLGRNLGGRFEIDGEVTDTVGRVLEPPPLQYLPPVM